MEQIDITIIGAGAIGLATAARLASAERTLVVLEANQRHGQETSSRNSEVIHAGIYYAPGSLKAKLCVRGKELLYDYGKKHDIKCRAIGKLIVAFNAEDEKRLAELMKRGLENGVSDLRLLSAAEVAKREPSIVPLPAIFSPSTGIFSADYYMDKLLAEAQDGGAMLLTQSPCSAIERLDGGYKISADNQEPFMSRIVINSAGLNADKVAALAGLDAEALKYAQQMVKGEYFRFKTPRKLNHLIYPPPGDLGL
ncbi:MAG TPA: FAD-dependent oxidoreductase, partial [Elusimicrobiales bacterium]|nr:FAD-dependent oxidoreductase [Elusimicrobiales bacterium]